MANKYVTVNLPREVWQELKVAAAQEGKTVSGLVVAALAGGLAESIGPKTRALYDAKCDAELEAVLPRCGKCVSCEEGGKCWRFTSVPQEWTDAS